METIKNYLENMFSHLPNTPEVQKAKYELYQMMEDKYNELISEGKSDNEAIGIVISEFGNLDELRRLTRHQELRGSQSGNACRQNALPRDCCHIPKGFSKTGISHCLWSAPMYCSQSRTYILRIYSFYPCIRRHSRCNRRHNTFSVHRCGSRLLYFFRLYLIQVELPETRTLLYRF